MSFRLNAVLSAIVLSAASPLALAAAPTAPSAEQFFAYPKARDIKLAPSGQHVAMIMLSPHGRDELAVLDLSTQKTTVIVSEADGDVAEMNWINDGRIAFRLSNLRKPSEDRPHWHPSLYAIDRDGKNMLDLAQTGSGFKQEKYLSPANPFFAAIGSREADYFYAKEHHVNRNTNEMEYVNLLKVTAATGRFETLNHDLGRVVRWILDAQGEPRLAVVAGEQNDSIHYLDPASKAWRKLAEFSAADGTHAIVPQFFDGNGKLFVAAAKGADKQALYSMDLASGALSKDAVVELTDFDFSGSAVYHQGKLLGLHYLAGNRASAWFDPAMQAAQADIDKRLKSTQNLLTPATRGKGEWLLVSAYSDQQPTATLVYHVPSKRLVPIASSHPQIDASKMAEQEIVHFKARDGLSVPAWLSKPPGAKGKLPLVVLVHGGPFTRGAEWNWDAASQFLTSRGYAVIKPEFRGSTGFGWKHFQAGLGQWGKGMQADLADAASWAVAQGWADGSRVCVLGNGAYAGYAAMMSLVETPDQFKCAIEIGGTTSLERTLERDYGYFPAAGSGNRRYSAREAIGPASAPLDVAARMKQPLLMVHGGGEPALNQANAAKVLAQAKAVQPASELVSYELEMGEINDPANRADLWRRIETFLGRHIGPAAP